MCWQGIKEGQEKAPARLEAFLDAQEDPWQIYEVDGACLKKPALHPVGMMAATAQGGLAVLYDENATQEERERALSWVERLWKEPLRKGDRRYYDNCLYFFAFLALSGNYRMW